VKYGRLLLIVLLSFEGQIVINGNNKSGDRGEDGNPGEHQFKNLPDGQMCLP